MTASLVLHYLRDWTAPLAELRRVLKQGGRLILSVYHPTVYKLGYPDALDKETSEALVEAQAFIADCLASWEERL